MSHSSLQWSRHKLLVKRPAQKPEWDLRRPKYPVTSVFTEPPWNSVEWSQGVEIFAWAADWPWTSPFLPWAGNHNFKHYNLIKISLNPEAAPQCGFPSVLYTLIRLNSLCPLSPLLRAPLDPLSFTQCLTQRWRKQEWRDKKWNSYHGIWMLWSISISPGCVYILM